jgi:hypothetical protein
VGHSTGRGADDRRAHPRRAAGLQAFAIQLNWTHPSIPRTVPPCPPVAAPFLCHGQGLVIPCPPSGWSGVGGTWCAPAGPGATGFGGRRAAPLRPGNGAMTQGYRVTERQRP